VRPTSARVREALFSVLGQHLEGLSVLDAFGGSGLLSFEAASRGAGPITVVERNRRQVRSIERQAAELGLELRVRAADAAIVLGQGTWDLVLLDPPYADDPVAWLQRAEGAANHALVLEHRAGVELPGRVGALGLVRARRYGDTGLAVYRPLRSDTDGSSDG